MTRPSILLCLLFPLLLLAGGCSDSNSDAPDVDEAHPPGFIFVHGQEAREAPADCAFCHGADFQGVGEAISCFACHFEGLTGADFFRIHPSSWDIVIIDHQDFAAEWSWTRCANAACHGGDLRGGQLGPSCFAAGCHGDGPPAPASHDVAPGDFFFAPQNHGPLAQADLELCRNCHGRPPFFFDGGFVADPAILGQTIGNCSLAFCHPTAMAHPGEWLQDLEGTGPNDRAPDYIATHTDIPFTAIDNGCVLCHEVAIPGPSPLQEAPPCTQCHPGGFPRTLSAQ